MLRNIVASCSKPSLIVRSLSLANEAKVVEKEKEAPATHTLLRIDWMMQKLTPLVLKSNIRNFIDICKDDVQLEDRLFKYNLTSRAALMSHIAKIRMYYRYLSPFNKVEWIGSCVYENEDVIVVLWRLSTLESSFMSYFPSFLTKKEQKMIVKEGALDIHINKDGEVLRIVNRSVGFYIGFKSY